MMGGIVKAPGSMTMPSRPMGMDEMPERAIDSLRNQNHPAQSTPVSEAINYIDEQMTRLASALMVLEKQMEPALMPQDVNPGKEDSGIPMGGIVVTALRRHSQKLERTIEYIVELTKRVEV